MMDSTLHSSALRGLRQNICIRDTQTNMEESEHEDKQDKRGRLRPAKAKQGACT